MGALIALDSLLSQRRVWRGQAVAATTPTHPTGCDELDHVLPSGGWPDAALSELLLPADGVGELQLLWPVLARLSQPRDGLIALIAPPYRAYPPAWHAAGVRLPALQIVRTAAPREAMWAAEQCLRSGACSAVLCWPQQADDRTLRRLQVAAETGQALGFALRPLKAAANPSPAALRLALDASPRQLRVLKCRGGTPPTLPIPFPHPVQGRQHDVDHGQPPRASADVAGPPALAPIRMDAPLRRAPAFVPRLAAGTGPAPVLRHDPA